MPESSWGFSGFKPVVLSPKLNFFREMIDHRLKKLKFPPEIVMNHKKRGKLPSRYPMLHQPLLLWWNKAYMEYINGHHQNLVCLLPLNWFEILLIWTVPFYTQGSHTSVDHNCTDTPFQKWCQTIINLRVLLNNRWETCKRIIILIVWSVVATR